MQLYISLFTLTVALVVSAHPVTRDADAIQKGIESIITQVANMNSDLVALNSNPTSAIGVLVLSRDTKQLDARIDSLTSLVMRSARPVAQAVLFRIERLTAYVGTVTKTARAVASNMDIVAAEITIMSKQLSVLGDALMSISPANTSSTVSSYFGAINNHLDTLLELLSTLSYISE